MIAYACQNMKQMHLTQLINTSRSKPSSIGPPRIYLGGKISKVDLPNGVSAWAISASQYVQEAVRNVELHMKRNGLSFHKGTKSPMSSKYRPELDVTPELEPGKAIITSH